MAHRHPLTFLITGCSSGLGLTLSRTVLAHGHNLIATSRNPSRTPDLVTKIEGGGRTMARAGRRRPRRLYLICG